MSWDLLPECTMFVTVLSSAELTIEPDRPFLVIPSFNANLTPVTFLLCVVTPALNSLTRWILPNGTIINFGDDSNLRIFASQGFNSMNSTALNTILLIQNISYEDAGTYTCEARNMSDSTTPIPWYSAKVELQLLGMLYCTLIVQNISLCMPIASLQFTYRLMRPMWLPAQTMRVLICAALWLATFDQSTSFTGLWQIHYLMTRQIVIHFQLSLENQTKHRAVSLILVRVK